MGIQVFLSWLMLSSAMASVLACIIFFAKAVFKNKLGAKGHYGIWFLLILRLVMPYIPESQFSAFNLFTYVEHSTANIINTPYEFKNVSPEAVNNIPGQTPMDTTTGSIPGQPSNNGERIISPANGIAWDEIFIIWILGIIILGTYAAILNIKFYKKINKGKYITGQGIIKILNDCKAVMGIVRELPVIVSFDISTPALFGFIRPKLIIPYSIAANPDKNGIKYIFFHELSHLKRKDIAVNWLVGILKIIHWFNPVLWYAFYRMRHDCEIACDTLALSHIGQDECKRYGNTIITLLEGCTKTLHLPGMAGILEDKSQIKRRITMISLFKKNSYRWTAAAVIVLVIIGIVFLTNAKSAPNAKANDIPVSGSDINTGSGSGNTGSNITSTDIENSEPKPGTVTTDMYEITLPDSLTASKLPGSMLSFMKSDKVVGGLEILGYSPGQPNLALFPNHSETLDSKELEGLELKAFEAKLKLTPPAASGSTEETQVIHIYLLNGDKNIAYDISGNTEYIDENTLLDIAKSFRLLPPYSGNSQSGANSSTEASNQVISTNHLNIDDGAVQGVLTLKMVKGQIVNNTDPGPFMGKNLEGSFSLELCDSSGKQVSSFDLNSAFNGESLTFRDNFDIAFEDYNGDGCMDFTIGQYASSNGYTYVLLTIDKQGKISRLPVKDANELFSDNMGYSPKLVRVSNSSFVIQFYDNSRGKRFESTYKWDNTQFAKVDESEI